MIRQVGNESQAPCYEADVEINAAIEEVLRSVSESFCIQVQIADFVKTSSLFTHVKEKEACIDRIYNVASRPDLADRLEDVCNALKGNKEWYLEPIFEDPDIQPLVVIAFIKKMVPEYHLANFFYWNSAFVRLTSQKIQFTTISLFDEMREKNKLAELLVSQTLSPLRMDADGSRSCLNFHMYLLPFQIHAWFEAMKDYPETQQQFLLAEVYGSGFEFFDKKPNYPKTKEGNYLSITYRYTLPECEQPTVLDAIHHLARLNVFYRVEIEGKYYEMIPSICMVLAILKVKQAFIAPVFRFGKGSSLRENGLRGERDVSLESEFAPAFEMADGFHAKNDRFTGHDLKFHLLLLAELPLEHQRLFILLTDEMKRSGECMFHIQNQIGILEDMEVTIYQTYSQHLLKCFRMKGIRSNLHSFAFWVTVSDSISYAIKLHKFDHTLEHMKNHSHLSPEEQAKIYTPLEIASIKKSMLKATLFALKSIFKNHAPLVKAANVSLRDLTILSRGLKEKNNNHNPIHILAAKLEQYKY